MTYRTNSHTFQGKLSMLLTVLTLILCSCEKIILEDEIEKEQSGSCQLTFNINGFSLTEFDTRSVKSANELGSVLNFAVFKNGEKIRSINQKNSDEGFGTVDINLEEGYYEIAIVVHSCEGNATTTSATKISFPDNKLTDTFAYYSDLNVSGNASHNITLERAVSMYRLTITDPIPDEVKRLKFYYTGGSSTLNSTTGFGCVNSRQTEYRNIQNWQNGQSFEVYTFPHAETGKLKMTVTALDAKGNTYKETVFEDVPIEIQKITNHSCTFFGGGTSPVQNGTSFGIKGEYDWKGEIKY